MLAGRPSSPASSLRWAAPSRLKEPLDTTWLPLLASKPLYTPFRNAFGPYVDEHARRWLVNRLALAHEHQRLFGPCRRFGVSQRLLVGCESLVGVASSFSPVHPDSVLQDLVVEVAGS